MAKEKGEQIQITIYKTPHR